MKTLIFSAIVISLMILSAMAYKQNKQDALQTNEQKQMQMAEIIQDSAKVNAVMEYVAANSDMRMEMMQKMVEYCNSDSTEMIQMFNAMTEDKEMHALMMKMMRGGMMVDSDMMQHDIAQKK